MNEISIWTFYFCSIEIDRNSKLFLNFDRTNEHWKILVLYSTPHVLSVFEVLLVSAIHIHTYQKHVCAVL